MTKYTKSAFNPHEKRVYINEEASELRWKDLDDDKKFKFVKISEIEEIQQGSIGSGISNHLSMSKIKVKKQFVVIRTSNSERKGL